MTLLSDKDWGRYLREYREAGGLSKAEVARALGLSESYVHMIEAGQRRVTPDFPARYVDAVQRIVRERAERIGFIVSQPKPKDKDDPA